MRNKLHSQSKYKFSTRNGYKKKRKGEPGGGRGSEEGYVTYDNMLPSDKDDKGQDKSRAESAVAQPARRARTHACKQHVRSP